MLAEIMIHIAENPEQAENVQYEYAWIWIVLFVLAAAAAYFLMPRPDGPKPASAENFDFATAQEGRSIPVVFGTVRLNDPNVVWFGDYATREIKDDVK
jgi:hypothetical protein